MKIKSKPQSEINNKIQKIYLMYREGLITKQKFKSLKGQIISNKTA